MTTEKLVPLIVVHRNKAGDTVSVEIIERGYISVWDDGGKPAADRLRADVWAAMKEAG